MADPGTIILPNEDELHHTRIEHVGVNPHDVPVADAVAATIQAQEDHVAATKLAQEVAEAAATVQAQHPASSMGDKSVFEDLFYAKPDNAAKLTWCLSYESYSAVPYAHLRNDNNDLIYSTADQAIQSGLFAVLLNSLFELRDARLEGILNGFVIFQMVNAPTATTTIEVLKAFRNAVTHSQFVNVVNPASPPTIPTAHYFPLNGYDAAALQHFDLVFFARRSGVYHVTNSTKFFNDIRHILNFIYNFFKLNL
jgi:hypothetical protein